MRLLTRTICTVLVALPAFVVAGPLVNLNTADRFELERDLIGVTSETASSIVQHRKENGKFESLEDVLKVEGVERDFLNINKDYLHLGNDPRLESSS